MFLPFQRGQKDLVSPWSSLNCLWGVGWTQSTCFLDYDGREFPGNSMAIWLQGTPDALGWLGLPAGSEVTGVKCHQDSHYCNSSHPGADAHYRVSELVWRGRLSEEIQTIWHQIQGLVWNAEISQKLRANFTGISVGYFLETPEPVHIKPTGCRPCPARRRKQQRRRQALVNRSIIRLGVSNF